VLFLIPGQKLDERKKLVTMLRKMDDSLMKSKLVAFEPPTGERLKHWLSKMVGNRGFTFAAGADDHFIELNGNDQMMLRSEMDKISLHLEAGGVITHELIERLGIRTFEQNVFKMIEYVCQKKLALAHELLHELYKYPKDNNPFLILNLVARQFRMMLIVKQLDRQQMTQTQIAGVVGASPYVVKLTSEMAKRWNSDKLMSIVSECADLDYAFKSGRIDHKLALELLVLRLAS
jgi:DNA polymerase-3 subunit delta